MGLAPARDAPTYRGGHSYIVDGVYASSDPSYGGETLYEIDTWDPWIGQPGHSLQFPQGYSQAYYNTTEHEVWSLTDWLQKQESTNQHIWYLWSKPYNNIGGNDPEPTAPGNYYNPNPPFPNGQRTHWANYYITIDWDFDVIDSANIALDQNYKPVAHH